MSERPHSSLLLRAVRSVAALFLLATGALAAAPPSSLPSELVGEIVGPDGAAVAGAEVVLTLADGTTQFTTSEAAGGFRFDALPEGEHRLSVRGAGFSERTIEITVGAGGEVRIRIPLSLAFTEQVLVTGQIQERPLRDEPGSVTVLDRTRLQTATDTDLYDLIAAVPNLNGSSDRRGFSIRGISQGGFGGGSGLLVTTVVDGAAVQGYQGTFFGPYSTWDLDRVEVFRGPQSTQQGRNALAGAVVLESRDPTYQTELFGRARLGNFASQQTAAVVNLPIVPNRAALRVSVDRRAGDGFVTNPTRDDEAYDFEQSLHLRAKLRFDPSARFRGMLTVAQSDSRGGDSTVNADLFPDERSNLSDHEAEDGSRHRMAALELGYDLTGSLSLESTGTLYFHEYRRVEDLDQTFVPAGVLDYDTDDQWATGDVRLRVEPGGRTRGVVGVYVANLEDELSADASGPGELAGLPPGFTLTSFFLTGETTRNRALYGEFDLGLGSDDDWTLTLGGRYDREFRETRNTQGLASDPPLPGLSGESGPARADQADYGAFLPKAAVTRRWTDTLSTSVSWQRGYRAGGRSVAVLSATTSDFGPEFTSNFEFALRAQSSDRRWRLSGNLFTTDWTDQQVRVLTPLGLPVDTLTVNAGESSLSGAEAELGYWPTRGLEIYGSAGLLRTRFDSFADGDRDFTGNEFPFAPPWSVLGGVFYRAPGSDRFGGVWTGRAEVTSQGEAFASAANDPRYRVEGRTLVNARVGYRVGSWGVFAFGRNLLDEPYLLQTWESDVPGFGRLGRAGDPRAVGIELDFSF